MMFAIGAAFVLAMAMTAGDMLWTGLSQIAGSVGVRPLGVSGEFTATQAK